MKRIFNADSFGHEVWQKRSGGDLCTPQKSLREVAAETGVSASTLSRIERGKEPTVEVFAVLCLWLGVPMETFIQQD